MDFNLADSIYGILRKYFSVRPAGSVQELEISLLDAEWAEIMGVAVDLPTLEIRRCAVTADNTPFEFAHDIYRGDRIIFTTRTIGAEGIFAGSGQLWQQALDNLQAGIS